VQEYKYIYIYTVLGTLHS